MQTALRLKKFPGLSEIFAAAVSLSTGNKLHRKFRAYLSPQFPRIAEQGIQIKSGQLGWMKLTALNDVGLLGAVLNYQQPAAPAAQPYSGAHNLHAMGRAQSSVIVVPILPAGS